LVAVPGRCALARGRLTALLARDLCKSTDGRPVLALLVGGTCPAETVHRQLHPKAPEVEKRAVRYDPLRCPQHGKEDDPNRTYQLGRDCKLSRGVTHAELRAAIEAALSALVALHGGLPLRGGDRGRGRPPFHWLVLVEGAPHCHVGAVGLPALSAPVLVWTLRDALRAAGLHEATASHIHSNLVHVRGGPGRPIALHRVGDAIDDDEDGDEAPWDATRRRLLVEGRVAWLCCADTKAARYCPPEAVARPRDVRRDPCLSIGVSNCQVYGGSGNANRMLYIVNAASRAPRPPEVRPCDGGRRDRGFVSLGLGSLACDVNRYRVPQRGDEAACLGVPLWVIFPVARKTEVLDSTLIAPEAARRLEVTGLSWRRCGPGEQPRALYAAGEPLPVAASEACSGQRRHAPPEDPEEARTTRAARAPRLPADLSLLEARRLPNGETLVRLAQRLPFRDGLKLTIRSQKVTAQRERVPEDSRRASGDYIYKCTATSRH
jgi:hypothetical protein